MTPERWRWVGLGVVALLAAVFAFANAGERAALRLGVVTLYRIPLVVLIFTAFLLGMVTMFLLGLRHDLQVRRLLEERLRSEPPPPPHRPAERPHLEIGHPGPPSDGRPPLEPDEAELRPGDTAPHPHHPPP